MQSTLVVARAKLPASDQFILAIVALSPVAWVPRFVEPSMPRIALALALLPLGVGYLVSRTRRGDTASVLAISLVVVGIVSALASPAVVHSLVGSSQSWIGALGYATAFAWWACGRHLSPAGRRWLIPALTIGAVWNVLLALVQVVAQADSADEYLSPGRAVATMHNPVYFGAFTAGITACWLARRTMSRTSVPLILILSFGAGLAGGRAVAGALMTVAVWAIFRRSSRRAAMVNLFVSVLGLVSATLLVSTLSTQSIGDRAGKTSGLGERLAIWRVGFDAFLERPLLGWGPANLELASERQFDLAYTKDHLLDDGTLLRWIDFHNVVLNVLVGFGILGFALAVGFVLYSCRGVQEPMFFAGAFAIAANWMLEPVTVHTLPIALILFGAAGAVSPGTVEPNGDSPNEQLMADSNANPGRRSYLMMIGCVVAAALLLSAFLVDLGVRTGNLELASAATEYGYRDQVIDDVMVQAYTGLASVQPEEATMLMAEARVFAERLARLYPTVFSYERLSEVELAMGDVASAKDRELRALDFQPWHPLVNERLLFLAEIDDDEDGFERRMEILCAIGSPVCEPETLNENG